jgi:hypothetical protein
MIAIRGIIAFGNGFAVGGWLGLRLQSRPAAVRQAGAAVRLT